MTESGLVHFSSHKHHYVIYRAF